MLVINSQKPPFDDIRARQALTFATDRDACMSLIRQRTAPPADTMFHPRLVWHNPYVKQETNMPERAGPLVGSYCADNPGNCSRGKINMEYLHSPSVENDRVADLLRASWGDFFDVDVVPKLQDEILADIFLGSYSVASARFFGEVDPDNEVILMECGSMSGFIALNFVRHCDEERDELMYEQRRIDDLDRRVEIWHRIQEIIRDSYTYIFLNHANWVIGTGDNVRNVCGQTGPDGQELFCNIQGRVQLRQIWLS